MDPTTSIPLHLTCETVVLATAGLLLAWSALRQRWLASISSLSLLVVQSLHAAQFVEHDDDPLVLILRLAAIAGLAVTVVPMNVDRPLFAAGLAAYTASTLWGAAVGGTASDVSVGPHVLAALGAGVLLVWVWRATRPSIRLRVLASFVAILAVAVVVAGGAVARVAAVNSRDAQYERLAGDAATIRRSVIAARDGLRRRVTALSPLLSSSVAADNVVTEASRLLPGEWTAVLDVSYRPLGTAETSGVSIPYSSFATLPLVRSAKAAKVASLTDGTDTGLVIAAAAPIFRPGGTSTAKDVIGIVVVGRLSKAVDLLSVVVDRTTQVAVADGEEYTQTDPRMTVFPAAGAPDTISLRTIETPSLTWLGAITRLPDGDARLIVVAPIAEVISAANDLVRAFLIAILAAAALAVIAALWLSARIARPMLDLADDAERVKADFLSSVSHELRTPLTPIRGYTEILRRGRVTAGDASGFLDEIGQAAQRLERIVALLLDVAAIEAGRFRVDAHDVPPGELLNSAGDRWRGRSRRHSIRVDVDESLPDVLADPDAVARVLDELIDNAIKFAPGGVVELAAARSNGGVAIVVRDEGPGMGAEHVEALREAFRQADTGDTRRYGGLGLGLAFAEGVLAAHGSRLELSTASDEGGLTCSFVLPAAGSVTRMSARAASRKR